MVPWLPRSLQGLYVPDPSEASRPLSTPRTMPLSLQIATLTDQGRVRDRNEDAVGADEEAGVAVVADGMGGHPAGHVASRLAVEEALAALHESSRDDGGAAMAEAVERAQARVLEEGRRDPEKQGMGTTLTALALQRETGRFHIGHVGDSRAYRLRGGRLVLLTRDQTWVQEQVEAGRISPDQARNHPWGHVLNQALGLEDGPRPALEEGEARPGDVYLLCSDGLNAMLSDEQIQARLTGALTRSLDGAARALVEAANEEGGVDNVTVALLRVVDAP